MAETTTLDPRNIRLALCEIGYQVECARCHLLVPQLDATEISLPLHEGYDSLQDDPLECKIRLCGRCRNNFLEWIAGGV